jgi:hypothetical protein
MVEKEDRTNSKGIEVQEVKPKYTERDIYYLFVKERARAKNQAFRFPSRKPFHEFLKTKSKLMQGSLYKLTERFNTAWCNVDPELYLYCGFKLFGPNFWFNKVFEPAIMTKYRREKLLQETRYEGAKERTKQSLKWISKYLKADPDIDAVEDYFKKKTGYLPVFVTHYMKDHINDIVLAWVWVYRRDWISYVDEDIQKTYLKTFKKQVYKHISFLTENPDIVRLITLAFRKMY